MKGKVERYKRYKCRLHNCVWLCLYIGTFSDWYNFHIRESGHFYHHCGIVASIVEMLWFTRCFGIKMAGINILCFELLSIHHLVQKAEWWVALTCMYLFKILQVPEMVILNDHIKCGLLFLILQRAMLLLVNWYEIFCYSSTPFMYII